MFGRGFQLFCLYQISRLPVKENILFQYLNVLLQEFLEKWKIKESCAMSCGITANFRGI